MKICIMGSGNEGTGIGALLAGENDVSEIVFADIDPAKAARAVAHVKSLGSRVRARLRAEKVDVRDTEQAARVAAGAAVVFHGILPIYNLPVMKVCLEAGAHYCDLLSKSREVPGVPDAETIEAQLEMDGAFKAAGLTAIPCIGISPGWTTLASKYIIDQLDAVDRLTIRNVDWIDSDEILACAPPEVILEMWLGAPSPVCLRNGRVEEVDLLASEELYEFPQPVGRQGIFTQTFGIDGIILNKFVGKPIGHIEEKGAVLSGGLGAKDIWLKAIQRQTSKHKGADNMLELFGKSFVASADFDFQTACKTGRIRDAAFASAVEVVGMKNERKVKHGMSCVSTLSRTRERIPWAEPGVFATIGGLVIELVLMMGRKEFNRKGVVVATDIESPPAMFEKIQRRGQVLSEKIEIDIVR